MGRAVLGLNFGHDRSACLVIDGHPVVALAEERLSRLKHDTPVNIKYEKYNSAPVAAVRYCLDAAGLTPTDLSLVVASSTYVLDVRTGDRRNMVVEDVRWQLPELEGIPVRIENHHRAHAVSALAGIDDRDAAVLVVDGGGSIVGTDRDGLPTEFERTSIFHRRGSELRLVARASGGPPAYGNSIGDFYQLISHYLGFGAGEEGKLMGLAGYAGSPQMPAARRDLPRFHGAIAVNTDGSHHVDEMFQYTATEDYPQDLVAAFGPPRAGPRPSEVLAAEIAAAAQEELERALLELAAVAYRLTGGPDTLCMAGGVALNCLANTRIAEEGPFADVWVQPAATDDGTALGNALIGWRELTGDPPSRTFTTAYLGRSYTDVEVDKALAEVVGTCNWEVPVDLVDAIVDDLVHGAIVALFRGGSEFGPRALGHRSILCDPRPPHMKDHVNTRVKHRELFRPFAPVTTAENAADYFTLIGESPYMLRTSQVKTPELLPAVTHVDGSARVQTVSRADEPFLHDLLHAFGVRTGVPVLLNTSFNDREPIVESPDDALRCLLATGIDVVYLEGRRVTSTEPRR